MSIWASRWSANDLNPFFQLTPPTLAPACGGGRVAAVKSTLITLYQELSEGSEIGRCAAYLEMTPLNFAG